MEENIVSKLNLKLYELVDEEEEKINQIIKEKRLDKSYEDLKEYKRQAEEEINNNGSKEASLDLIKINEEIEKVEKAMADIKKELEDEITYIREGLYTAYSLDSIKKEKNKEIYDLDKAIETLLKNKEEAEEEIRKNGNGSEEAKRDLDKINEEISSKKHKKEQCYQEINKCDLQLDEIAEKYNLYEEEQLNQDWEVAIEENEQFDKQKQLNQDWEAAIEENEQFDKQEQLNQDWETTIEENEEFNSQSQIEKQTQVQTSNETQTKRQKDREEEKGKRAIRVLYRAKDDTYVIKDLDAGYVKMVGRKELFPINKAEMADKLHVDIEKLKYLDSDIFKVLAKYNTAKAKQYYNIMTSIDENEENVNQKLVDNKLEIKYDLRGLYDKTEQRENIVDKFTDEERKILLGNANVAKEIGVAKVKKGFVVTIRETFEKIVSMVNRQKMLEKSTKENEEYAQLTNSDYLRNIEEDFDKNLEENWKNKVENKKEQKKENKRKIKNKPKTNIKQFTKRIKNKIVDKVNSFADGLKIDGNVKQDLDNISRKYQEKDNSRNEEQRTVNKILNGSYKVEDGHMVISDEKEEYEEEK